MARPKDEIGKRYGRLTVLRRKGTSNSRQVVWACRCDCGTEVGVLGANLRRGITQSCGCLQIERTKAAATTHGMSGTSGYQSYQNAYHRCRTPTHIGYANYGGRGIEFRLPPFEEFWAAMGPTWFEGATIERIDNDGHYELGNVRWATRLEQAQNTSQVVLIEYGGKKQSIAAWARELGISHDTMRYRLRRWPLERAMQPKQITERKNHVS